MLPPILEYHNCYKKVYLSCHDSVRPKQRKIRQRDSCTAHVIFSKVEQAKKKFGKRCAKKSTRKMPILWLLNNKSSWRVPYPRPCCNRCFSLTNNGEVQNTLISLKCVWGWSNSSGNFPLKLTDIFFKNVSTFLQSWSVSVNKKQTCYNGLVWLWNWLTSHFYLSTAIY